MRIRITAKGVYIGPGNEAPIGTELDVSEEPKGWKGRYEVVIGKPKSEAVPITNPEDHSDKPRRGRPRKEV